MFVMSYSLPKLCLLYCPRVLSFLVVEPDSEIAAFDPLFLCSFSLLLKITLLFKFDAERGALRALAASRQLEVLYFFSSLDG